MKKDYYGAISDYSRCIELNQEFMPIYKARGVARLEIGDYTGALSDFDIYLKSEKSDAYAFYQRAMVKIKMGKIYDCCVDLLAAQNLGYDDAKAAIRKYCN
jgi:tetratricopeptide (TPR) repeat protein